MFGEALPFVSIDPGKSRKLDISIALQNYTINPIDIIGLLINFTRYQRKLDIILHQMKFVIGQKDKRFIKFICLDLIIFRGHLSTLYKFRMNAICRMYYTYLMIKQVKKFINIGLCIVDIASRYKVAYPLADINSSVVANALKQIYNSHKCPLN